MVNMAMVGQFLPNLRKMQRDNNLPLATQRWNVADMEADTPLFAPYIRHRICPFLL
jgi:hypothetical protein